MFLSLDILVFVSAKTDPCPATDPVVLPPIDPPAGFRLAPVIIPGRCVVLVWVVVVDALLTPEGDVPPIGTGRLAGDVEALAAAEVITLNTGSLSESCAFLAGRVVVV